MVPRHIVIAQEWIRCNTDAVITANTPEVIGDILIAHHPFCRDAQDAEEAIMIVGTSYSPYGRSTAPVG